MGCRERKATPPDFIGKSNRPGGLLAGPGNQTVSGVFFTWYCGSGLVIGVFGALPGEA
jgi:hypothetical protein